jgi:hypothetical protein
VQPIRLYPPRRPVILVLAGLLTGTVGFAAVAVLSPISRYVVTGVIAAGFTAILSCLLVVKLLRRRPYLEIDATGVTSRTPRASVPWSEVREIRFAGQSARLIEIVSEPSSVIRILVDELPGSSAQQFFAYARDRNPRITVPADPA